MFVFVFLCYVVLWRYGPLRQADNSSKGVLPSVYNRLRNLRCEAAKVLTTVEPLMMTMNSSNKVYLVLHRKPIQFYYFKLLKDQRVSVSWVIFRP
jgi:hypothetical protein